VALGDGVEADDLAGEAAAKVVGEAAAVGIVFVQHRGALAAAIVGELRDRDAVRRVARDDAEGPGRDASELWRRGRRRDGGEVAVVNARRRHHGAGRYMADDGDDRRAVDEALGDRAGVHAVARIVGEQNLEMTAGPGRAGIDLFDGELDALLVGLAVRLAPRSGRAESDRAGALAGARGQCGEHDERQKPPCPWHRLPSNEIERAEMVRAMRADTAKTTHESGM